MTPALTKDELSIIRIIFMQDEATRSEIASHLGTSLIKVSSLLESLEKNGFIYKEERRTKRGRPSYMFRIVKDRFYAIGISFGIDSFRLAVTNTAKDIIHEEEFPFKTDESDKKHIQSVVNTLEKIIRQATEIPAAKDLTPVSVGVSLPGMVDTEKGVWILGLQIGGVENIPLARILEERTGVPVFIEDAARTYAFYEKIVGAGKALKNFVLLYLDRGIGTGIVINHELYLGSGGLSGEIGHIIHQNNAYRCACGSIGCLETVTSSSGIIRVFMDRLNEGVISHLKEELRNSGELSLEAIREAAEKGDRLAITTLFETGQFLGDACALLIKLFNPQAIIIDGHCAILKDFFQGAINQQIRHQVIPEMIKHFEIMYPPYNQFTEAHGAALFAVERLLKRAVDKTPSYKIKR